MDLENFVPIKKVQSKVIRKADKENKNPIKNCGKEIKNNQCFVELDKLNKIKQKLV